MPTTADQIWQRVLTEKEVDDLDDSIKYRFINRADKALYRAQYRIFPDKYIKTEDIDISLKTIGLTGILGTYIVGEIVTDLTGLGTATVVSFISPNLIVKDIDGTIRIGNVIKGGTSLATGTMDTIVFVDEYALPSDFLTFKAERCGIYLLNNKTEIIDELEEAEFGDILDGFWTDGVNINVLGRPRRKTWLYRYIPQTVPVKIDSADDNTVIPDGNNGEISEEIMIRMLMWLYDMRDEEEDQPIIRNQQLQSFAEKELARAFEPVRKKIMIDVSSIQNRTRSRNTGRRRTFIHLHID